MTPRVLLSRIAALVFLTACVTASSSHVWAAEELHSGNVPIPITIEQAPGPGCKGEPPIGTSLRYVPTFESIGLYWAPEYGASGNPVAVRYREGCEGAWLEAQPLWFDGRTKAETDGHGQEYRGSIVHLAPGTTYEVELSAATGQIVTFSAKTWSETFPIAETVFLPEVSTETLRIGRSGRPDGYILYTHEPGKSALIDGQGVSRNNIEIEASYVIVRGLTLEDAAENGIWLGANAHHVIIEENDISGWGRLTDNGWGWNLDAGIRGSCSTCITNNSHLVIQRNRIHHPRGDANSWAENLKEPHDSPVIDGGQHHPAGPQGIYLSNPAGNLVIRYNDIYSDEDHRFNDLIGGSSNFSFRGFPNRDSDIYGNRVSYAWDDGIESEGANMNVRIWGNYVDKIYNGIAIAGTSLGPLYIWRNVGDRSELDPDGAASGVFIKAGSKREPVASGRTYIFHNTVLQRPGNMGRRLGFKHTVADWGGRFYEVITRNNLFALSGQSQSAFCDATQSCSNSWDYDWYEGRVKGEYPDCLQQRHGIQSSVGWIPTYWELEPPGSGNYKLKAHAPGIDRGILLPNFNDHYLGAAPDMGALEQGSGRLETGVDAYRGQERWGPR